MYPGRRVKLQAVEASVYPIAMKNIKKFSQKIVTALMALAAMRGMQNANGAQIQDFIQKSLGPLFLNELLDLVQECSVLHDTELKLEDLPHWDVAPLVKAFIEENFVGEEKLNPWKETIQTLVEQGSRLQEEQSSTKETVSSS